MPTDHRAVLAKIKRFDQLIAYLRDEMGWPIARDSFEDVDDLFYDFTADELGIDAKNAAKIQEIKRLRPLSPRQPWGIFFVKFEPKKLPVVALRRILSQVALKKRASANSAERAAWAADDLLFVSNYGEGDERQISFAHFSKAQDGHDLPTLKVLGWDNLDTALHLDAVARELTENLAWPEDDTDVEAWRTALARRLHPAPPRGRHYLEGTVDPPGRAGPRHPRPHQDRARHRDREGPAHQADEGVPGGAGPRPRRRRLRRHVRADHRLRPALGAHRRPAQEDGRRLRRPHAHQPVPAGADGDLPQGRWAARQGGWAGHRLRRARRERSRGACSTTPTWRLSSATSATATLRKTRSSTSTSFPEGVRRR